MRAKQARPLASEALQRLHHDLPAENSQCKMANKDEAELETQPLGFAVAK